MANAGLQLLGFSLAFVGFIGMIASTVMAEWKMSSYAGDNIITAQAIYEGLWKSCVSQSTGQVQCKVYDSLLHLPAMVQGTRGLMLVSIIICLISMLVAIVGMKCTTILEDQKQQKNKVAMVGGIMFIISGLFALVGTSWYGHRIAQEFYDPFTPTNARYEFGAALFVGWGAACLTIIGGAFLCCNCSSGGPTKSPHYPPSRPGPASGTDRV
ncbi:claudin-1 [Osmerus eperlanus]|uniref:claudin-1 n=1 Tax=Osmerus eperlanus TaxID=29151 RepID=UPI002E10DB18